MQKEGRSKHGHTYNKAKQHCTLKVFPKKNELPQVRFEPTTLHTLDRMLYRLSSAGWARILHLIVNLSCTGSEVDEETSSDVHVLIRDEKEGRKKQARSTRQSNTAHPRQSLFLRKMSCLRWDLNPRHSTHVHVVAGS